VHLIGTEPVDLGRRAGRLIGTSLAIHEVQDLVERIKDGGASVLITGESGTGKELVAREIHERGARREGPFVAINCAAIPEPLLESELFGHVRGAFTDARCDRAGLFVAAAGGTLLLDEIGDMPVPLQGKLLRVLEERAVRPIGGSREVSVDVRIIAATNRDPEQAVENGRLREDLYYRLNVIHIDVPPLRARGGDVAYLARHFLGGIARNTGARVTGFSPEATEKLLAYDWPGNVRELRNCVERAVALADGAVVGVNDLPLRVRDYQSSHVLVAADDPSELVTLEEVERRYITRVVETCGKNKSLAARVLGISRKTLYRRLESFRLRVVAKGTGERHDDGASPSSHFRTTALKVVPA
jgi:two-component system response regulator HydG